MKIAFIIDYIWDYRISFYQRLGQLGEVAFFLTNQRYAENIVNINYRFVRSKLELLSILLKEEHDIIIWGEAGSAKGTMGLISNLVNAIICLLASRVRRKPFIIWFGGWEFAEKDHWKGGILNTIRKIGASLIYPWLLKKSDAIVTYGNFHKDFYVSLGVEPRKIFVAPNSSIIFEKGDSEKQVAMLKEKLRLEGKKVILYVGRLEERKNVDILIKAFARLKQDDICLLIIGDGSFRPYLEELCRQLNLRNVFFLGKIKREELPPYYRLCDVFVYPTSREPWGLAINEAMQFGKPVIATHRVAAVHDLIKHGVNGFIVPERNAEALAEAIEKIILDEEVAKIMGKKSREIIQQSFTYEHMAEGFRQAIQYCHRHRLRGILTDDRRGNS